MEIVVKHNPKIDWKKTAAYRKARRLAEQKYPLLSDKEKAEAHRNMAINDLNLPGLPAFFPSFAKTTFAVHLPGRCGESGHTWSNTIEKFCLNCGIDKE